MTLTETIRQEEERARRCYTWVEEVGDPAMKQCGDEHMQLAEWLKDYKRMLEEEEDEHEECNPWPPAESPQKFDEWRNR